MMERQIATYEDADLILKLYQLRQEAVLRQARHWLIFEFNPKTMDEFLAVVHGYGSQENDYYRQVVSYWEMAASMVLHGAVTADLFLDSNGEGIYIFARFNVFRQELQAKTGRPFMRHTAQLVETYPTAKEIFNTMLKSIEARAS
ncbi:MAG: DUF4760 domain-containing protein [Acidobacteriaceae bacterium]